MNAKEMITMINEKEIHDNETDSIENLELFDCPRLAGHLFEIEKKHFVDHAADGTPVLRIMVILKHYLPNGEIDPKFSKIYVFLFVLN